MRSRQSSVKNKDKCLFRCICRWLKTKYEIHFFLLLLMLQLAKRKGQTVFSFFKLQQWQKSTQRNYIHCVAKGYAFFPVSTVKCLYSRGRESGREATPTSISIFDFYDIKTLWFEFGNDIFTGNKMPTL